MALQPDTAQPAELDEQHGEQSARLDGSSRRANAVPFVPRPPVEAVYEHTLSEPSDEAWVQQPDATEHAWDEASRRRLRGVIPMLWTAAFAGAALMHAAEADRRALLREPSAAELQMQERPARQIKAAWRSIREDTGRTPEKPPTDVASEDTGAGAGTHAAVHVSLAEQTASEETATTETATTGAVEAVARTGDEDTAKILEKDPEATATHAEEASPIVLRGNLSRTAEKAGAARVRRSNRNARRLAATSRLSAKLRWRSVQRRTALTSVAYALTPRRGGFNVEVLKLRLARNMP